MTTGTALRTTLATGLIALLLSGSASAAPIEVVANGNDSGAGSLRKAIEEVDPGGAIVIPASVGEISLTTGQLEIGKSLTIEGAGAGQTTISAGRHSRVIAIIGSPIVTIEGVQIIEGRLDFPGQEVAGAGIDQAGGSLTLVNSLVTEDEIETGSTGFPLGGGIAAQPGATSLALRNTVVADDRIHGLHNWGGGIYVKGANLTIEGGSIKGNTSEGLSMFGGGLYFDGTQASLSHVAVTGNETRPSGNTTPVGEGGGLELESGTGDTLEGVTIAGNRMTMNDPTAEHVLGMRGAGALVNGTGTMIVNSTISDNTVTEDIKKEGSASGGGLQTGGTTTIVNSSLVGNAVNGEGEALTTEGGDLYAGGRVEVENSLFAEGTVRGGGQNCAIPHPGGELISLGHNIDSLTQCDFGAIGDQSNTDPKVGPLAENGGPVETMALQPGSPAIDAGSATGCPATDARGVLRPAGAACDIGAFEVATPTATTEAARDVGTGSATLAGLVTNPDLAGGTVSFQYGTSTAYGSQTAAQTIGAATRGAAFTAPVTGLKTGTTYHFRVVVENAVGTTVGADWTFTTPAAAGTGPGPGGNTPVRRPRLTVGHLGGLRFRLHCAVARCHGRLVAAAAAGGRKRIVASARLNLRAGRTETVALKLDPLGRRLAARPGKLALVVKATVVGGEPPQAKPLRFKLR